MREKCDSGNLDRNYLVSFELNDVLWGVKQSITAYTVEENIFDQLGGKEDNFLLIQVGYELYTDSIKTLNMPYECAEPPHDKQKAEPPFSEVDSPGLWSGYSFCSTFPLPTIYHATNLIVFQLAFSLL